MGPLWLVRYVNRLIGTKVSISSGARLIESDPKKIKTMKKNLFC
jgi:hypothetical protein